MAKLKPTLESHSSPCCGECVYCHKERGGGDIVCFSNPPVYAYGDEENAVFVRPVVDVKDFFCQLFRRKTS